MRPCAVPVADHRDVASEAGEVPVAPTPEEAAYAVHLAPHSKANPLAPLVVTVSPIRGTYAADDRQAKRMERRLKTLLAR
ncbi:MAG: hypothetical protein AAGG11_12855 [Pseudomonadota bacterium]